jgi:hypothetical protein
MYVLTRQPNRGKGEFSVVGVLRSGVDAVANLFRGQLDAVVGIFGLLDSILVCHACRPAARSTLLLDGPRT